MTTQHSFVFPTSKLQLAAIYQRAEPEIRMSLHCRHITTSCPKKEDKVTNNCEECVCNYLHNTNERNRAFRIWERMQLANQPNEEK